MRSKEGGGGGVRGVAGCSFFSPLSITGVVGEGVGFTVVACPDRVGVDPSRRAL